MPLSPIRYADRDTFSFRQLDELNKAPKGTSFRAFKACEPRLQEGKDFFYLDAEEQRQLIEQLKATHQIYATSVNLVLLTKSGYNQMRHVSRDD